MRILVLSSDFPPNPGGVAVFVHNLCIQLCRYGHQVHVLTRQRDDGIAFDQTQPYRIYRYSEQKRLSSIPSITKTLILSQRNRYDVVFLGHFTTTHAFGALIYCKLHKIPLVILSHGNDVFRYSIHTKIDKISADLLFKHASKILANSSYTANQLYNQSYCKKPDVLNPGVDHLQFHPDIDSSAIRGRYGLDNHKVLLTVSRLTAKKNIDGILRALPQVISQVPNAVYIIIGDGEERTPLENLCDELELNSYVLFLGNIENNRVPAYYCASDLFLMPSYNVGGDIETFGISYTEANACEKPVIASEIAGLTGAVINSETGLLVDPHDTDAIADAIIRLLTNPDLTRRLGKNGRKRVETELTWEIVGKKLENYLKQVIR